MFYCDRMGKQPRPRNTRTLRLTGKRKAVPFHIMHHEISKLNVMLSFTLLYFAVHYFNNLKVSFHVREQLNAFSRGHGRTEATYL